MAEDEVSRNLISAEYRLRTNSRINYLSELREQVYRELMDIHLAIFCMYSVNEYWDSEQGKELTKRLDSISKAHTDLSNAVDHLQIALNV